MGVLYQLKCRCGGRAPARHAPSLRVVFCALFFFLPTNICIYFRAVCVVPYSSSSIYKRFFRVGTFSSACPSTPCCARVLTKAINQTKSKQTIRRTSKQTKKQPNKQPRTNYLTIYTHNKQTTETDLRRQRAPGRLRGALQPGGAGTSGHTPHRAAEHGEPPVLQRAAGGRERGGGHQGWPLRHRGRCG